MITPQRIGDRLYPVVTCDACGAQIVEHGNVEWRVDVATGDPRSGFFFACKGHSDAVHAREGTADGELWLWEDIDIFLLRLAINTRLDLDEAGERAQLFAAHGL